MHRDASPMDMLPDDAFIIARKPDWVILFSSSQKRIFVNNTNSRPIPLELRREDLQALIDITEHWSEELQEALNQYLLRKADVIVQIEVQMARLKSRRALKGGKFTSTFPPMSEELKARVRRLREDGQAWEKKQAEDRKRRA